MSAHGCQREAKHMKLIERNGTYYMNLKKNAPLHLLIKLTQKMLKNFFRVSDLADFQINKFQILKIFKLTNFRPIPDLYL